MLAVYNFAYKKLLKDESLFRDVAVDQNSSRSGRSQVW